MVVLGLGSNIGDRLTVLRQAFHNIKKIPQLRILHTSPIYQSNALLPENAPKSWDIPYFNLAVLADTSMTPEVLLHHCKRIERELGRQPGERWGPRIIDIDILAWDDLIINHEKLKIPHPFLHERPFALWPLADLKPLWIHPTLNKTAAELSYIWGDRFSGNAPFATKQLVYRVDTPQLMGVLNVTPDSFSDGGVHIEPEAAFSHLTNLVNAGAEIIDIGAESTRPGATKIDPQIEWQRLYPILNEVFAKKATFLIKPRISIDTRHAETARLALDLGVDWINDVSGLENEGMCNLLAQQTCDIVFMHHLTIPEDRSHFLPLNQDPVTDLLNWAKNKILTLGKKGITSDRLIFDVGIGFGKLAEQSIEILKNMPIFRDLDVRLLVGHSRKSFFQNMTALPAKERDLETVILSMHLAKHVDFLRVHNVDAHARAFKLASF